MEGGFTLHSTLVPLIRYHVSVNFHMWYVFTFHFGSINTSCSGRAGSRGCSFTFHFGSINTEYILKNPVYCGSLHSTLVPLILVKSALFLFYFVPLHSTLVPLIRFVCGMRTDEQWSFIFHFGSINTEGVWWKNCDGANFTFHFGSINTGTDLTTTYTIHTFTFHFGSINTTLWCFWMRKRNFFTFHFGSINTMLQSRWEIPQEQLYIPLWFH